MEMDGELLKQLQSEAPYCLVPKSILVLVTVGFSRCLVYLPVKRMLVDEKL